MTAIPALRARATRFERVLLDLASGLEHIATTRAERRGVRASASGDVRAAADAARTDARALGGLGMLPR